MHKNKLFIYSSRILIALVILSASFSILAIKPKASEAQSGQNNNTDVPEGIQQRLDELKERMLTILQQQAQIKGLSYAVPSRFQGATIEAAKLPPSEKVIALTFDDGPWPESTNQVLDILKKNNIKATFFVLGQNVKNYPDLLKRENAEGHIIGNHTWHHWYQFMNQQTAGYEINRTANLINQITGVKTNLFRPPGGIMHNGVADYARNNKYAIVLWSSDSTDYSRPAVPKLIKNVFREAKPGGIVLMHDGGGNRSRTVQALPEIIAKFRQEGYQFVTIPELLQMEDKDQSVLAKKK
ncbi:MAG: polysaccharide deacetylase family protein [Aulosira sp. ZfuVER01]|nr:polysaccharide deacetylase family protein [Aulosira sp. ZfuVER01]MDZ8002980.1 polysaccharide deacetylase family protein [Aulosira sp. DedVER01a]MDZ8053505.1 polysaccharide deacetylase family protein [Aulosira sp. ZfuCHP01]